MKSDISGIIVGIITTAFAFYTGKQSYNNELDKSSDWRKNLMDVASKYEISYDDAQRVRASLRFRKHDKEPEIFSFKWLTNIMIDDLDCILEKNKNGIQTKDEYKNCECEKGKGCDKLEQFDQKVVRLFAYFLLKYHFEYRKKSGLPEFLNIELNSKKSELIKEVYTEYLELQRKKINEKIVNKHKNKFKYILIFIIFCYLFSVLFALHPKIDYLVFLNEPKNVFILVTIMSILVVFLIYSKDNEKEYDSNTKRIIENLPLNEILKQKIKYANLIEKNSLSNKEFNEKFPKVEKEIADTKDLIQQYQVVLEEIKKV